MNRARRVLVGLVATLALGALLGGTLAVGRGDVNDGSPPQAAAGEVIGGTAPSGEAYELRISDGADGRCLTLTLLEGGGAKFCGLPQSVERTTTEPIGVAQFGNDSFVFVLAGAGVAEVAVERLDKPGVPQPARFATWAAETRLVHAAIAAPSATVPREPSLDAAGVPATGAPKLGVRAHDAAGHALPRRVMGGPPRLEPAASAAHAH